MFRIGMIGAGWVTEHHLKAYRQHAGRAKVVAVADPDPAARKRRADAFDIPATYADAAEMLAAERLDAVDIATPRESHVAMCELAAARGVAILCQKPLAPNLQEAQALVRKLPVGVRLMVHENWRFRPHYRMIRQWLREGHIGTVRRATMAILTSGFVPDARGPMARHCEAAVLRHARPAVVDGGDDPPRRYAAVPARSVASRKRRPRPFVSWRSR